MTHRDWLVFARSIVVICAYFLARLYFIEWQRWGLFRRAHRAIWKNPKGWQVITVSALWTFIIVSFVVLVWLDKAR